MKVIRKREKCAIPAPNLWWIRKAKVSREIYHAKKVKITNGGYTLDLYLVRL